MQEQYEKIFSTLREIHPPTDLAGGILARLSALQRRSRQRRIVVSVVTAWVSALVAIPAFGYVVAEISHSGFGQYAGLLFSDGASVLAAWQDYATLLVETLPWASLTVALASVFALIVSLHRVSHMRHGGRWTPLVNST